MSTEVISSYFEALCNRDGARMRSIFTEDGVIDDYVGRHHQGGAAIQTFINQVARRKLKIVSDFVNEKSRWTAVAQIDYPDGRVALVRWIFHLENGKIAHVANTAVQQFPETWKRSEPLLMESR